MGILSRVSRLVWPAVICPETGYPLSCATFNRSCPFTWRPQDFPSVPDGVHSELELQILPVINSYFENVHMTGEPPGPSEFGELMNAFKGMDDPGIVLGLLSIAGALEALERALTSEHDGTIPNMVGLARAGKVHPMPENDLDWKEYRFEYNLHLASLCLLSVTG